MKIFASDILLDAALVLTAQLCFGRIRLLRSLFALFLMQMMTALYFLFGEFMRHPLAIISHIALISALLIGKAGIRNFIGCAIYLFAASAVAAGTARASCIQHPLLSVFSVMILLFLMRPRKHICYRWDIEIYLECSGRTARFSALIDTGNRLREPISSLPVLIVETSVLPVDFAQDKPMRKLAFGVLGSSGEISAFLPDSVRLIQPDGSMKSVPECYVALYPGNIPGRMRALAPPEFTQVMRPVRSKYIHKQHNRRSSHAVFQHQTINLWSCSTNQKRLSLLYRRQ